LIFAHHVRVPARDRDIKSRSGLGEKGSGMAGASAMPKEYPIRKPVTYFK